MMRWCLAIGLLALVVHHTPAQPIPENFRGPSPTFRQETKAAAARVIVFGTISNPRRVGVAEFTDFSIETTLRDDPVMKGRTSLIINRYLPAEKKNCPPRYVLFCDIEKGKVVPYRGFVIRPAASVVYFKRAIAFVANEPVKYLLFLFDHLEDPDPAVAEDAFHELAQADDFAIGATGRKLSAGQIRKRLLNPKTPQSHVGVYAKLLAAAGTSKDAALLFALLENDPVDTHPEATAILVASTMLAPKSGWGRTMAILGNRSGDFYRRYGALRAVRAIHDSHIGVVSNRQITAAYRLLLRDEEMVDIAIEDLRRWKRWDLADSVLAVTNTKAHEFPPTRWSLLRYALQCEKNAAAKEYVAAMLKADPEPVADSRKVLESEAAEAKKTAETPK